MTKKKYTIFKDRTPKRKVRATVYNHQTNLPFSFFEEKSPIIFKIWKNVCKKKNWTPKTQKKALSGIYRTYHSVSKDVLFHFQGREKPK